MTLDMARLEARAREQARACVRESMPLERLLMAAGRPRGAQAPEHDESGWQPAAPGTVWGGPDEWVWFRAWFRVPAHWAGERVRLALPFGGQAMTYLDGAPWQ